MSRRPFSMVLAALALVLPRAGAADDADDRLLAKLRAAEIPATSAGVTAFLETFPATPDELRTMRGAIAKLGSRSFAERERATERLERMPHLRREEVVPLTRAPSQEVRRRARRVLGSTEDAEMRDHVQNVLRFVERQNLRGLTSTLLAAAPCWSDDPRTADLFADAIANTAATDDLPALRAAVKGGTTTQRRAAIAAIDRLEGDAAAPRLKALLHDADDMVRLEAATRLLDRGHRDALPVLVNGLESDDLTVRAGAARTLRSATGYFVGYAADDADTARRARHAAKWRAWMKNGGGDVPLRLPVGSGDPVRGRILVCRGDRLVAVDFDGRPVRTIKNVSPGPTALNGCLALPNGRWLVSDNTIGFVAEYDLDGEIVWEVREFGGAADMQRLPNGNTLLLASGEVYRVLEITREGRIVWSWEHEYARAAQRVENGDTFVYLPTPNKVIEIDRDGTTVWELEIPPFTRSAQRLPNGHVLVTNGGSNGKGRATEYDRDGRIVWEKAGFHGPSLSQRLPNGLTAVSDSKGVRIFDLEGEELHHLPHVRGNMWGAY